MEEALELALGSDLLQRAVFPDVGIAADMVEHSVRQDEEAAIDPSALVGRLFLQTEDARAPDAEATEPAWGAPGGDRTNPAVRRSARSEARRAGHTRHRTWLTRWSRRSQQN